jgi:hypothetical protein
MKGGPYSALAGRIQQLLVDIERVVQRIELLHHKAISTGDSGYFDGIALNLHSLNFSGCIWRKSMENEPNAYWEKWQHLIEAAANFQGLVPGSVLIGCSPGISPPAPGTGPG